MTNSSKRRYRKEQMIRIMIRDGPHCRHCGGDRWLTRDHVVARSMGGSDDDTNLQVLCFDCNNAKMRAYESVVSEKRVKHAESGHTNLLPRYSEERMIDDGCPCYHETSTTRDHQRNGWSAEFTTSSVIEYVKKKHGERCLVTEGGLGGIWLRR